MTPAFLSPLVYALLRILTAGLAPVPVAVMLDPLPVLLARRTREPGVLDFWGLLFLPGLLVGDGLAGVGVGPVLVRALVVVVCCMAPPQGGYHRRVLIWSFGYVLATAICLDLRKWYPLGFATLAGMIQQTLWWAMLAPRAGGGSLRPLWPVVFPSLALLLVHLLLPTPPLAPLPHLGDFSSGAVRAFAMLILIEPLAWWGWGVWRDRGDQDGEEVPGRALLS